MKTSNKKFEKFLEILLIFSVEISVVFMLRSMSLTRSVGKQLRSSSVFCSSTNSSAFLCSSCLSTSLSCDVMEVSRCSSCFWRFASKSRLGDMMSVNLCWLFYNRKKMKLKHHNYRSVSSKPPPMQKLERYLFLRYMYIF